MSYAGLMARVHKFHDEVTVRRLRSIGEIGQQVTKTDSFEFGGVIGLIAISLSLCYFQLLINLHPYSAMGQADHQKRAVGKGQAVTNYLVDMFAERCR